VCPKCTCGYGARRDDTCADSWLKCKIEDCKFEFCSQCDIGSSVHEGKTCQEVASSLKLTLHPTTTMARPCPACQYLLEKISGCDHITCNNCSYEFCWICNASYYPGHLKTHEETVARFPVHIPGQSAPLQITTTPHTLYKMQPGAGVQPSTVNGADIPSLFQTHTVVKMIKIATTDPITGKTVHKEGILLKKIPVAPVVPVVVPVVQSLQHVPEFQSLQSVPEVAL